MLSLQREKHGTGMSEVDFLERGLAFSPDKKLLGLSSINSSSSGSISMTSVGSSSKGDIRMPDMDPPSDEPKSKFEKDLRLFPQYPLYCEGHDKPTCRGLIHCIACIWLCVEGMRRFLAAAGANPIAEAAGSIFVVTNILCYGVSALYHIGKWGVNVEIFLQKIDHCCISIFSAGTMVPAGLLLLPRHPTLGVPLGYGLVGFSTALAIWVCVNIFRLKPSVFRQVVCAGSIVPFVPWLYSLMTPLEWHGMLGCMFFQGLGVAAFTNRRPDPIPTFFGYHEVFHVCVTLAGFCALVCNYSIVLRCCGGGDVAAAAAAGDVTGTSTSAAGAAAVMEAAAAEGLEVWGAMAALFGASIVTGLVAVPAATTTTTTAATAAATAAVTAATATASAIATATEVGSAVLS